MTITTITEGSAAVLALSGWLDTQAASELQNALDALDGKIESLTLDMKELEYISSAGLWLLVSAHKKLNGNLTIRCVSSEIMDIFKIAGFDKRMHIEQ